MYTIEFFSGAAGSDNGAHGYDGSMRVPVAHFDIADLVLYSDAMDCIYGPCVAIVTTPEGYKNAYPFERRFEG